MSSSNPIFCISCNKELQFDHIGIKCVQNHNICSECVEYFVETIFENPNYLIPVKCQECSQEVPSLIFERQLTPEQLEIYQLYIIQNKISIDEKFQCCPHCKYFEIWTKESTANFFYCKNPECRKLTCAVCIRDVKLPGTDLHSDYFELETLMIEELSLEDDDEDFYEQSLAKNEGIYYHFNCGLMKKLKETIEKVIEKGSKRRCPSCKLAGRKDDACTHMTCPKCSTVWCYFCEKDVKDLGDDIFEHNYDWENDIGSSCPMYLTQISDIDSRWPIDDDKCLDRFHDILTKKLLKRKIEKLGLEDYNKILEQFPNIKNTVPTLEELENEDVKTPFIVED